jgi:two-component system sensor histidine kinase PilS (NtrC family)
MARGNSAAGSELHRRLQLSLLLRVIMVTFLLGATVVIQFTQTQRFITIPLVAIYILSAVTYFVTLLSVVALRFHKRLIALAYLQILWEIFFVTCLIYVTGAIESIFSFLYLLAVIVGGTLQYRLGSFLAAFFGTLAYGLLLASMEAGWVPPLIGPYEHVGWIEVFYVVSINLAAMFGMAVLSSYLTEKLRTTGNELQETMHDRDTLEALNDNIVRSLSSGLLTLDLEGRIMSFNQAAEKITGRDKATAVGKMAGEIFPQLGQIMALDPALRASLASRHEIKWDRSPAQTLNLEFRISPLRAAGDELLGTMVIFNDISEVRQMEERLRKADRLAAVGKLAAGIAHEIRNPLASISGSIQVLDHDLDLDQTSRRLMRIVVRETDRLNSLITDFLLYARPEPRSIEQVRLDHLIPEMIEIYHNRTDIPANIKWQVRVDNSVIVETDPKLLQQIFWNLLNNAIQAMPEGGDLAVRAYYDGAAGDGGNGMGNGAPRQNIVVIEVEDSGIGIPPENKERIFDPFFTTRDQGTGLGLSTVYRIVEAMNGVIAVEDGREQRGTRFVIKIPGSSGIKQGEDKTAPESGGGKRGP